MSRMRRTEGRPSCLLALTVAKEGRGQTWDGGSPRELRFPGGTTADSGYSAASRHRLQDRGRRHPGEAPAGGAFGRLTPPAEGARGVAAGSAVFAPEAPQSPPASHPAGRSARRGLTARAEVVAPRERPGARLSQGAGPRADRDPGPERGPRKGPRLPRSCSRVEEETGRRRRPLPRWRHFRERKRA
ncbi:translation initiation factor IF-2-like isoform X2 [Meles meles]|uniref:translation initiation factor IF-2-like isoform X2 n=1 Tax=Meles meles TaxID=9662 RepID=UPI001E69B23E|nr:translation initiation factor IF-2-like isoform X2 [Meles meles]